MPKVVIPDAKVSFPATRNEALQLIEETFAHNEWDASEQNWFIESLGLSGNWKKFDNENLKVILTEMDSLKMILFIK